MSFHDNGLKSIGIIQQLKFRRTDFVLYPEIPLKSAFVVP